jgi:hypothetical protein
MEHTRNLVKKFLVFLEAGDPTPVFNPRKKGVPRRGSRKRGREGDPCDLCSALTPSRSGTRTTAIRPSQTVT